MICSPGQIAIPPQTVDSGSRKQRNSMDIGTANNSHHYPWEIVVGNRESVGTYVVPARYLITPPTPLSKFMEIGENDNIHEPIFVVTV